ncbi:unnamed protein product [Ectocarpus sp. CCAP 1310/34]|nr:unnamed protein product [Ectocarpus sp. CCAP 1310/34]
MNAEESTSLRGGNRHRKIVRRSQLNNSCCECVRLHEEECTCRTDPHRKNPEAASRAPYANSGVKADGSVSKRTLEGKAAGGAVRGRAASLSAATQQREGRPPASKHRRRTMRTDNPLVPELPGGTRAVLGALRERRRAGGGAQGIYQYRDGGRHPARRQIMEFEDPGCLILLRSGVWTVDENKDLFRGGTLPSLDGDVEWLVAEFALPYMKEELVPKYPLGTDPSLMNGSAHPTSHRSSFLFAAGTLARPLHEGGEALQCGLCTPRTQSRCCCRLSTHPNGE